MFSSGVCLWLLLLVHGRVPERQVCRLVYFYAARWPSPDTMSPWYTDVFLELREGSASGADGSICLQPLYSKTADRPASLKHFIYSNTDHIHPRPLCSAFHPPASEDISDVWFLLLLQVRMWCSSALGRAFWTTLSWATTPAYSLTDRRVKAP